MINPFYLNWANWKKCKLISLNHRHIAVSSSDFIVSNLLSCQVAIKNETTFCILLGEPAVIC